MLYTYKCDCGLKRELDFPHTDFPREIRCICGKMSKKVLSESRTNFIENFRYGQVANKSKRKA